MPPPAGTKPLTPIQGSALAGRYLGKTGARLLWPGFGLGSCQPTTVTPHMDPTLRCDKHAPRFIPQLGNLGMWEMTSVKQGTVNLPFLFLKIYEQDWVLKWGWDLPKVNLYPLWPP